MTNTISGRTQYGKARAQKRIDAEFDGSEPAGIARAAAPIMLSTATLASQATGTRKGQRTTSIPFCERAGPARWNPYKVIDLTSAPS
jgi:hypothetical protein